MQTYKRKIEKYDIVKAIQFDGSYQMLPEILDSFSKTDEIRMTVSHGYIKQLCIDVGPTTNVMQPSDYLVIDEQHGDPEITVQSKIDFEFKFGTSEQKTAAHHEIIRQLLTRYVQNKTFKVNYHDEDFEYRIQDAQWFTNTLLGYDISPYLQSWETDNNAQEQMQKYVTDTLIKHLDRDKKLYIEGANHYPSEAPSYLWK